MPWLSPGKSMPVSPPKPNRWIHAASRTGPSILAIVIAPTFDERARICETVIHSVGRGSASWITRSATRIEYGSLNFVGRRDDPGGEGGGDRHELEGRAGLEDVGDAAVPLERLRDLARVVCVVAGRLRHREDGARSRIEHDRARILGVPRGHGLAQHLFRLGLDGVVERRVHVGSLADRARLDDVDRASERIVHLGLDAGAAGELLVVRQLEPAEPLVVRAGEADDLRADRPLRIGPLLLRIRARRRRSPSSGTLPPAAGSAKRSM